MVTEVGTRRMTEGLWESEVAESSQMFLRLLRWA
jgi:hypothetical protein